MLEVLNISGTLPFTSALGLLGVICLLEAAGAVVGLSILSSFDLDGTDEAAAVFGLIKPGGVPALIVLVLFLTAFGLGGLGIQAVSLRAAGATLPPLLVCIPAGIFGCLSARWLGQKAARLVPQDETSAMPEECFIGRVATIIRGKARKGLPAEARFVDEHGTSHYVLVEPDAEQELFHSGDKVLLVKRSGAVFIVISAAQNGLFLL